MKKTLLIIALIYVNIIVFATTARITIHMSDQATGFLTLYAPVNGNWQQVYHEDNHQYQQGENIIVINASFDLGETISPYLNYDAWTSWGAGYTNEINLSYQIYQGNEIYGGSDYCSFWYPKDMKVFIKPNTDVVAPVIKLYSPNAYGGDDHLEGTINNINLQPNVWNEVIFQDVVPYGTTGYLGPNDDDYKNCYEKHYEQKKKLGLFTKPSLGKIEIVKPVEGKIIVGGYSGLAKDKINQLLSNHPELKKKIITFYNEL